MLTFRFNGKCGKMEVPEKLVSGTIGKQVLFQFSPDWNDLKKTVVFMALDGSSHAACSVEVSQELLTIPAVVLANPEHTLYVQIQGYSDDGIEVINTGRVPGPRILPGIDSEDLPEIDAKNPIWYDVLTQIGDLDTLETESKNTIVSAINELALDKGKPGPSAYDIALQNGFEGTLSQWLESLKGSNGKSAYDYALDAGFIGSEEDFSAALQGNKEVFCVDLLDNGEDGCSASASYMEIAHARALGKLVLLRYGIFMTHILAGAPTDSSFLFEPLLHSVPGMPGYIVDIQDNWASAPVTDSDTGASEAENNIYTVTLEETGDGQYSASASYMEIAHARALGKLVLLRYGVFMTHILAGAPTESSFLFEPLLHSVPGMPGYIVDIQDNWTTAPLTRDEVLVSDIVDDLETNASDQPLSAAQGVVLKGLYNDLNKQVNDLEREGNEILIYGYADAAAIGVAALSGRPVYCLYEHLYYLPLVSWDEATHTAVFGGCCDSKIITCTAVAGEWSVEITDVSAGEQEVFVGTEDTTVAEFHAAFESGKPCFLIKANAGEGTIMWVAYTCNSSSAKFYRVTANGSIQYGVLSSDGTFSYETAENEREVFVGDEKTTVAEYYEASMSGKICFMKRAFGGSGATMWTAYSCSSSNAHFYQIGNNGVVGYGTLSNDGSFVINSADLKALPFVGDSNTTVAEFYEAYQHGRACFMIRPRAGGTMMWTLTQASLNVACFGAVDTNGYIMGGTLNADGTWEQSGVSVSEAVNDALAQAKASGEFDGKDGQDGHTPVKGVDYLVPTSDSTEQPSYGPELATASGWTATGWTGDFASGFTHTSGNTTPLIFSMPEDTGTNIYRISFKCSTSIEVEALMVKCGNSDLFDLYGQAANPIVIGIQSVSNGNIEFVPASNFNGKITDISIKRVLAGFESEHTITDSNGGTAMEVRATKASQNNLFVGKNSGKQNISGYGCAGFGANALESNTSGFWNVGIGYNALQNNSVGSRNVGIGYIALQSNTTGTRNIAVGSFALWHNTTGNKNIAIGADSLDCNVSGSENVAIGLQALYSNVSGNFNTAVGSGALTKNTGSNNTAVGKFALSQCTSGSNNVGLGYSAGTAITTGKENLAIGTNALYKLKTGAGNIGIGVQAGRGQETTAGFKYGVFVGYQSGYSLANDADYNIMMGFQAGYSATTGDNNIFIGNKAGYNTTTGADCILIGSNVDAPADSPNYGLNIGNLLKGSMESNGAYLEVSGSLRLPDIGTTQTANNDVYVEEWTFTLEDGSTVTRKVLMV